MSRWATMGVGAFAVVVVAAAGYWAISWQMPDASIRRRVRVLLVGVGLGVALIVATELAGCEAS